MHMIYRILKSKKGMTLTEIIVGSLLFAIAAAMVAAIIGPMMMAFSRANAIAEYNMLLDSVGNRIVSDIAGAIEPPETLPFNSQTDDEFSIITASEIVIYEIDDYGRLVRNDSPVFPADFYGGRDVSFTVTEAPANSGVFTVSVTVSSDGGGGGISTRDYVVRPLMLIDG